MNAEKLLEDALNALDGRSRINEFVADAKAITGVASSCAQLAIWVNTLSAAEPDNPALAFLYEMQRSSHDVAALLATAFYVPAAAAMRSCCETALYYTYFRSHPVELTTLASNPDFYVSKQEILDFHKLHSIKYAKCSRELGFPSRLNEWYSRISAIVHGQLPGAWGARLALEDTRHQVKVLSIALKTFIDGVSNHSPITATDSWHRTLGEFSPRSEKKVTEGFIFRNQKSSGFGRKISKAMNDSRQLRATKERLARMSASSLRQLAKFLNKIAKDVSNPIYTNRVLTPEFGKAVDDAYKAAWKVSDIVVPRDPKTGHADVRKLLQAVMAHAFRPDADSEESKALKKKTKPSKPEGDALLRTGDPLP